MRQKKKKKGELGLILLARFRLGYSVVIVGQQSCQDLLSFYSVRRCVSVSLRIDFGSIVIQIHTSAL